MPLHPYKIIGEVALKRPVTVVPADSLIIVNGKAKQVDISTTNQAIHAIQWKGMPAMTGHIEYKEQIDGTKPANLAFNTDSYNEHVYPYVVLWEKSK